MLKDPEFNSLFNQEDKKPIKLHEGVFISSFDFNYSHTLHPHPSFHQEFFILCNMYEDVDHDCYGVCDNFEQILEKYKALVEDTYRHYTIGLTEVKKSDQPDCGGWRWHKWGEYIGDHEPTCEYLYDEPIIEKVFVYSIVLLEDKFSDIVESQI